MNKGRILIDAAPDDPAAELVAAMVEDQGAIHILRPDHDVFPEDMLWFTSQVGFLEQASRLHDLPCKISVILRRTAQDNPANDDSATDAVLRAVFHHFSDEVLHLYAASEDAAQEMRARGFPDCVALGAAQQRESRAKATADLDPSRESFRLQGRNRRGVIGTKAVNWARLASDYHLVASSGLAPDWWDLADLANRLPRLTDSNRIPRYLFVTPNGVGIGHLTRQLAVARALELAAPLGRRPRIDFWCFSRAAIIAQKAGYRVILRHTSEHIQAETADWQAWETEAFARYLRDIRPTGIVTDGSRVEPFIVNALKQPGCHHSRLIWIQRGMWRADADDRGLADIRFCDHVLIPGDLASSADLGSTGRTNPNPPGLSRESVTAPVVLTTGDPARTRHAARRSLKLGFGRTCLVSLGGDAFARTSTIQDKLRNAARRAGVRLVWAQSPLATRPWHSDPKEIRIALYPLNRHFSAFDGIISAAGYNSFHELMLLCDRPVLFIPTNNERLDDQSARARFAAAQGWAQVLETEIGGEEDRILSEFLGSLGNRGNIKRPKARFDGAAEMASVIAALSNGPEG